MLKNEVADLKDLSRRDFFSQLCSKDTVKDIFGAWHNFNKEINKTKTISCEDAGLIFSKKVKKFPKDVLGKEG